MIAANMADMLKHETTKLYLVRNKQQHANNQHHEMRHKNENVHTQKKEGGRTRTRVNFWHGLKFTQNHFRQSVGCWHLVCERTEPMWCRARSSVHVPTFFQGWTQQSHRRTNATHGENISDKKIAACTEPPSATAREEKKRTSKYSHS
jgi:hypothetical protein